MTKLVKFLSSGAACLALAYATIITPYCTLLIFNQPKAPDCLIK
jgi:cyclic lactone autoinducer peptide